MHIQWTATMGLMLTLAGAPAGATEILHGAHRVIDADTVEIAGKRIRLSGIDAPERGQRCRNAAGQCYLCGKAATKALQARIGAGTLRCTISSQDRYGRALGTCYAADGADLQAWLVENGHALAYRRYSQRYVAQEKAARRARAGIHAGKHVPPWRWRRPHHERLNPQCP